MFTMSLGNTKVRIHKLLEGQCLLPIVIRDICFNKNVVEKNRLSSVFMPCICHWIQVYCIEFLHAIQCRLQICSI